MNRTNGILPFCFPLFFCLLLFCGCDNVPVTSAIDAQTKNLESDLSPEQEEAVWRLGKIGPPAVLFPMLTALENQNTRDGAIKVLGQIGDPAIFALVQMLDSLYPIDRLNGAYALLRLRKHELKARSTLSGLLRYSDEPIRIRAIRDLSRLHPNQINLLPALKKSLFDKNIEIRIEAARIIGTYGFEGLVAVPELLAMQKDEKFEIRIAATRALGELAERQWDESYPEIVYALASSLKDENPGVRKVTCNALARVEHFMADGYLPLSDAALKAALDDTDPVVQIRAAYALREINPDNTEALNHLIGILLDKNSRYRVEAAHALGNLGYLAHPAIPALAKALADKSWSDRAAATLSLGLIGPDEKIAVPALIKRFQGRYELGARVLRYGMWPSIEGSFIIESLGKIGPGAKEAVPEIAQYLPNYPLLSDATKYALLRIDPEALEKEY